MDNKVYTPKQAWEQLRIGRTHFYQLLKDGKIRYFKNGNRYLIPADAIEAFIAENIIEGGNKDEK